MTFSRFSDEIEEEVERLRMKARDVHAAHNHALRTQGDADLIRRLSAQLDRIDTAIDVLNWAQGKPVDPPSAFPIASPPVVVVSRGDRPHGP